MKKVVFIAIALIVVIIAYFAVSGGDPAGNYREIQPDDFTENFQPEELHSDIDFLIENFEEIHPDLYWAISKEKVEIITGNVKRKIDRPLKRMEFFRIISPMVSLFQDGHTYMEYPEELYHYAENKGLFFPLEVAFFDKKLYMIEDYSGISKILPESEIVSINGIQAGTILKTMFEFTSGKKTEYRLNKIKKNFRYLLWVIYGFGKEFGIEYLSRKDNKIYMAKVPGVLNKTIKAKRQAYIGTGEMPDYILRLFPEYNTGIIYFNSFRDHMAFQEFLKDTFSILKKKKVENLIIDIRKNGGGSSKLGDALLQYITDKPFAQVSKMEIKVSRQSKNLMKKEIPAYLRWLPIQFFHPYARKIWGVGEGNMAVFNFESESEVTKNPLRFNGELYLLTGIHTFSSAVMLAATFKDYKLGTIIGEETGGLATHFGDIFKLQLPNSGLSAGISFKRFVRPGGFDDGRGVLPDIKVSPKPDKDDIVLKHTLKLIKSKK